MSPPAFLARGRASLAARLILGAVFVALGAIKASDPVAFLKMLHAFDLVHAPLLANPIAAVLPWFEIACGLFLLSGVCARGAALVLLVLLLGFTGAIVWRAVLLQGASQVAFCALRFDCGCGTGEVRVCAKLAENALLSLLAGLVWLAPAHPFPRRAPAAR